MARVVLLGLLAISVLAQRNAEERASWNQPVRPFRIIGNIHYVGVQGVSAFLISTPNGAILLDGGFPESAPLIAKSISESGFKLTDIKILLNSHAHYDHCGGLTELKRLSGAQMIASYGDSSRQNTARVLNCSDRTQSFQPVKVDRVIADGETVELGAIVLTAHITAGHTMGCTTWSMPVSDGSKTYAVVFSCSTTVAENQLVNNREYPAIATDYERSFARLRRLPCDVFLAPHGSFFRREAKESELRAGNVEAFVDPAELQEHVNQSEQAFRAELARQQRAAVSK